MKTLSIIFSLVLPIVALARIGETEDQCTARYGQPANCGKTNAPGFDSACSYNTGRFIVAAMFLHEHCESLIVQPRDKKIPFTNEEIQAILNANDGGSVWHQIRYSTGDREFKRSDDKATAFIVDNRSMMIESSVAKAARAGMAKF